MLVLTTVVAIFFGLWVSKLHRQQQALKNLRAHSARIRYREVPHTGWLHRPWSTRFVGGGLFGEPVEIYFTLPFSSGDAELHPLAQLSSLQRLSLKRFTVGDDGMPYLAALRNPPCAS